MNKTITASNQSFQYLYSVVADANISTIDKLRTAKSILSKIFSVVNAYETDKAEPVSKIRAIDKQIEMYHNAGQQIKKADEIEALQKKRSEIMESDVSPLTKVITTATLSEDEVKFVLNEMSESLAAHPKMNTAEEMEMFDLVFTALEEAEFETA